uniref:Mcl1_mid domain-containing protein n=1 Tax=Macrostomum lignano TaxID=282301 RepID=A0A1I8HKM3_9PLAT
AAGNCCSLAETDDCTRCPATLALVVWSSSNVVAGLKQPLRAGRLASVLGGRAALVSGFAASNAAARRLALVRLDGLGDGDSEGEPWKQVGECADFTDGGTACPLPLSLSADLLVGFARGDLVTYWSRGDRTLAHLTVGWDCGVAPLLGSEHRDSRVLVAAAWLTKRTVDAASVEVARGFRLTAEGTLETVSVAVPRVIDQLFQDDLLGRCSVTWQPSLSAANWLSGSDPSPLLWPSVSLQPEGMPSVTQVASDPQLQLQFSQKQQPAKQQKQQQQAAKVRQVDALDLEQQQQQKETELVTAMLATVQADAGPLPQDLMEGADSDEWSDD